MAISEQDVTRIARLARIELSPEETVQTQKELNDILGLMAQLQAVDTQGVEPIAHPLSAHQDIQLRLRDDVAAATRNAAERADLMATAPAQEQGLFLVPTVIDCTACQVFTRPPSLAAYRRGPQHPAPA